MDRTISVINPVTPASNAWYKPRESSIVAIAFAENQPYGTTHYYGGIFLIYSELQGRRKTFEKISVQRHAQLVEQTRVDAAPRENIIDIPPVAMYLATEPSHATLLAAQLFLNDFSDKYRLSVS